VVHILTHPESVQAVLLDKQQSFNKGKEVEELRYYIGNGLLSSEGSLWVEQRKLIGARFAQKAVEIHREVVVVEVDKLLETFTGEEADLEITGLLKTLTLDIIIHSFFSNDLESSLTISNAIGLNADIISTRLRSIFNLPRTFPSPRNRLAQKLRIAVDEEIRALIRKSKARSQQPANLLGSFIEAARAGEITSDDEILVEIKTLLFAGYDTTASTLTWLVYCLASNPKCQQKLYDELAKVSPTCSNGKRPSILSSFENLPYLEAFIKEVHRLYPAIVSISRRANVDVEITGFSIPKGSIVNLPIYITHRHPDYWESPEEFRPERFLQEKSIHPFSYLPFGKGKRKCIGEHFSRMVSKVMLANLVLGYEVGLAVNQPIEPKIRITLRIKDGLKVNLKKR